MDRDMAGGLDDDAGVVGEGRHTAAGALHDRGQADPDEWPARGARLTGLGAPAVVCRQLQGAVQGFGIFTGVVGEARRGLVGKRLWWDEVLPAHRRRVELQVCGDQVDGTLQAKGRLRAACAPVGPGRWLIGDDPSHLDAHGRGGVRPGEAMAGEEGHRGRGHEEIRPQVCHNLHPEAQQGAIPLHRCLHVHRMSSAVEGEQVFPALLHPLHRTAQADGQVRYGNLFGVQAPLFPKAAAHVGGHHTHTALRSVQHLGQVVPDRMGVLGRVPHGQDIVLGLVLGHDPTCLQRCWSQALHLVALPDDVLGLRQGRF